VSRWVTQLNRGGGDVPAEQRGDCFRACIVSILGLGHDAMGNHHGEDWWDRVQTDLAGLGYSLVNLDLACEPPRGYWIATVPSLNLPGLDRLGKPQLHCLVAESDRLVWDPAQAKTYGPAEWRRAYEDGAIREGNALVPLDPLSLRVATLRRRALDPA